MKNNSKILILIFCFIVVLLSVVCIRIYDALGKEITELVREQKDPGIYTVEFNANKLPSGIYFYTLTANNFSDTKKMFLIK